jgi:hypothetical protein
VTAALWMAWLIPRLPRSDSRRIARPPEGTSAGAVPLQAAKWSRSGEPEDLADVADHGAGDDRAGAEDAGQAGAGGLDRRGQLLFGVAWGTSGLLLMAIRDGLCEGA